MNGRCFGRRVVEEVQIQGVTKELYMFVVIQQTNAAYLELHTYSRRR
jgi:hypothetical protein